MWNKCKRPVPGSVPGPRSCVMPSCPTESLLILGECNESSKGSRTHQSHKSAISGFIKTTQFAECTGPAVPVPFLKLQASLGHSCIRKLNGCIRKLGRLNSETKRLYSDTKGLYSERLGRWYSETGRLYSEAGRLYSETAENYIICGNWYSEDYSEAGQLYTETKQLYAETGEHINLPRNYPPTNKFVAPCPDPTPPFHPRQHINSPRK